MSAQLPDIPYASHVGNSFHPQTNQSTISMGLDLHFLIYPCLS